MGKFFLGPGGGDGAVSPGLDRSSFCFVWMVWLIMLLGALAFVRKYGSNAPFMDEWGYVDVLTGHEQVSAHWLWEQNNEHRIPLPKLVYTGLARLANSDFRVGMYFNVAAMALMAGLATAGLRRQRGFTIATDALVPIIFLHVGHYENLLFSFQVEFVISTVAVCVVLLFVPRSRDGLKWIVILSAGLGLIALPFCGAHGLPFVPPLAGWLLLWAWRDRKLTPDGRRKLLSVVALVGIALASLAFYFVGYEAILSHAGRHTWPATREAAWQFLTMAFGTSVMGLWNYACYLPWILAVANIIFLLLAWRRGNDRVRLAGYVCFLVAMAGLALGVGWGRGAIGPNLGFAPRYTTLAAPALLASYLIWENCAPVAWARFFQLGLFTTCAMLCYGNTEIGLHAAAERREQFRALERDLYAHLPPDQVADRNSFLYPQRDYLIERLEWLRAAGIGQFRHMSPLAANRVARQTARGRSE